MQKTIDDIVNGVYAGLSLVLVETTERTRLEHLLAAATKRLNAERPSRPFQNAEPPAHGNAYALINWDAVEGLTATMTTVGNDGVYGLTSAFKEYDATTGKSAALDQLIQKVTQQPGADSTSPYTVLEILSELDTVLVDKPEGIILLMHNLHEALNDQYLLRTLLDNNVSRLAWAQSRCRRMIVCGQPTLGCEVHKDIKHLFVPIQLPLPTATELAGIVHNLCYDERENPVNNVTPELEEALANRLCGLAEPVAENVAALTLTAFYTETRADAEMTSDLSRRILGSIDRQKADLLQSNLALRYIPVDTLPHIDALRGFDGLLSYISSRAHYTAEARAAHLDPPRGVILIGLPGTGKSAAAKAVAKHLNTPLFILDVGALFGSLVGQSERQWREVVKTIEAQRQCVLLIDEADKCLGGMQSGNNDSGVSTRMFGGILSWLQERKDNAFVIMTMNRTTGIPPELFRPGRFDQIFGVVEPDLITRQEILKAHFASRHCDPTLTDEQWEQLGVLAGGNAKRPLVGAALEEVVKQAMATAFTRTGTSPVPTFAEISDAMSIAIKYDSSSMHPKEIDDTRTFINANCRPVTAISLAAAVSQSQKVVRPPRRVTQ